MVWIGLVGLFGMVWIFMVRIGMDWIGLVWIGMIWISIICFDFKQHPSEPSVKDSSRSDLLWLF